MGCCESHKSIKKFGYKFVFDFFKNEGYSLLSKEYENKEQKLEVVCPEGHNWTTSFGKFKNGGNRCLACSGQKPYTYEEVRSYFSKHGYILVSDTYKNKEEKLKTICPNGHEWEVTFGKFKNNKRRCLTCSGQKPYTYEEVKTFFEKENYTLITSTYTNNKQKLEVVCPEGHNWIVSFKSFNVKNSRCITCSGQKPYTYEEVKTFFEKENYVLITDSYEHNEQKLEVLCPKGHKWSTSFKSFNVRNSRCPTCSGLKKHSIEEVSAFFSKEGYKLLSDVYLHNKQTLEVRCPIGHAWETNLHSFKNGKNRCPTCGISTSKPEIEIFDTVKALYPNTKKLRHNKIEIQNKPHIHRFEVDIFIPELNKGIEFDGKYYHSFQYMRKSKPKWPDEDIHNYHQIKDDYFKSKGINLLHIKEEDWMKDKQKCIDKCLEFLTL